LGLGDFEDEGDDDLLGIDLRSQLSIAFSSAFKALLSFNGK
jgi:hypothetical protein